MQYKCHKPLGVSGVGQWSSDCKAIPISLVDTNLLLSNDILTPCHLKHFTNVYRVYHFVLLDSSYYIILLILIILVTLSLSLSIYISLELGSRGVHGTCWDALIYASI